MLTLDPASACEVCAESFGPGHVPAVIPCGHVFCAQCLATIVDKTSPRFTPACPLCRGTFSDKTWRLIRVDLGGSASGSGWSGADSDHAQDVGAARVRADAKRLEDKVAQAATKKCSFEEVSALHKEVQDWLSHDPYTSKTDPQHASLRLSADLLRAILLNSLAYSESSKAAKTKEAALNTEVERLQNELRRQRDLVASKSLEIDRLRDELNKLRPNNVSRTPPRTPTTPPRPGTSLGIHHSSKPFTSASAAALSRSNTLVPVTRGPSGNGTAPSTPARDYSPPDTPAILPPPPSAPVIPFASLPPSTPALRASTPAPAMFHRRASSSIASVPQRPSTAMGSAKHERWLPSTTADLDRVPPVPPLPAGVSRPRLFSSSANASRSSSTTRAFPVVQETD